MALLPEQPRVGFALGTGFALGVPMHAAIWQHTATAYPIFFQPVPLAFT